MALNPNKSGSGGGGLLDPENFGEGLWQGGRAKILDAKYEMFQAPGSRFERAPVAYLKLKDANGEEHEERWSFGKDAHKRFKVIEGGARVQAVGTNKVNKGSKVALLMASIDATNWEWTKPGKDGISADIKELKGYTAEFERVPMEVGEQIKKSRASEGKGELTVMVVSAFVEDGAPAAAKASTKGKAAKEEAEPETAEEPAAEEVDADALLTKLVTSILSEYDGNKTTVEELQAEALKKLEAAKEDADDEYNPLTEALDDVVAAAGDTEDWLPNTGKFEVTEGKDGKGKKKTFVGLASEAPAPAKKKLGLGKK